MTKFGWSRRGWFAGRYTRLTLLLVLGVAAAAWLAHPRSASAQFTTTQTFTCNNCPRAIPDNGTTTGTIIVPAASCGIAFDVNVGLTITHTWRSDLDVFVENPGGTRVELFTDLFGFLPGDVGPVVLDDEAATKISVAPSPCILAFAACIGTFQPESNPPGLSILDQEAAGGTWELDVADDESFDTGTLLTWSLTIACLNSALLAESELTFSDVNQLCLLGTGSVTFDLCNIGNLPLIDLPATAELIGTFGGATAVSCSTGTGTCSIVGGAAHVNLNLPVGACTSVTINFSVEGGTGNPITFTRIQNLDTNRDNIADFQVVFGPDLLEVECLPTVNPNAQLGAQVHLPILNFQGQDDVCRTWIEVQNVGNDYAKAALVTWGAPGFCPPQCAGPLKVECTGLLKPGSTWNFLEAQVPTGSKSGMLFRFTAKQLSEIGVDLGDDDIVADAMCENLFFGIVGDCDDYRRFKKAYNEGLEFFGIPQDDARGDGILAVEVLRHCPGDVTPGVEVSSKYDGIAGDHLGAFDPVFGGFAFYVPLLYADQAEFNSVMYIQNGGLECTSVEIWFKAQDDCLRARICEIFTLAPGESFQFAASDCVGPQWQGSAWLRSSQPLGIAVDIIGRDVMMTYVGEPAELNFTFDPNQAYFNGGNQVAFGPLVYSEYQGWDTGIQVQNLSSVVAAKVKVYFLDRSGGIITTLVDWICPRGSQTFFLPVVHDLPGNWVGSVRVESQEWWSPGDPLVLPPNIVGIVTLLKYSDAARTQTTEAMAYNLLPEHKIFDWQIGYGAGGLDSGVGLIAIPSLLKDLDTTGVTAELAITNVVPKPGFTDFAIFIYDQNGLLDYVCEKLNEKQVEYIDLQTWGYVNPGFKGSAIISATFWEHDVFAGNGAFLRNLVGLGAVIVERTGTRMGEDVPGDEAAGTRGIPFRESDVEDEEFLFRFQGPAIPVCPGTPIIRPKPGDCTPDSLDQTIGPLAVGPATMPYTTATDPGNVCQSFAARRTLHEAVSFEVCTEVTLTITLIESTLTNQSLCGNAPFINAILYGEEPNVQTPCTPPPLDSSLDNPNTGLTEGLYLNQPYVYEDPGDNPLVLQPGTYYLVGHSVCDFFVGNSTGNVTYELDFSAP